MSEEKILRIEDINEIQYLFSREMLSFMYALVDKKVIQLDDDMFDMLVNVINTFENIFKNLGNEE